MTTTTLAQGLRPAGDKPVDTAAWPALALPLLAQVRHFKESNAVGTWHVTAMSLQDLCARSSVDTCPSNTRQ